MIFDPKDTTHHLDDQTLGYRLWCIMEGVTDDAHGWYSLDLETRTKYIETATEFVTTEEVQGRFPDLSDHFDYL